MKVCMGLAAPLFARTDQPALGVESEVVDSLIAVTVVGRGADGLASIATALGHRDLVAFDAHVLEWTERRHARLLRYLVEIGADRAGIAVQRVGFALRDTA